MECLICFSKRKVLYGNNQDKIRMKGRELLDYYLRKSLYHNESLLPFIINMLNLKTIITPKLLMI